MFAGADYHLTGAVPAWAVVQVYGAHLLRQAREDTGRTADAAAPDLTQAPVGGVLILHMIRIPE